MEEFNDGKNSPSSLKLRPTRISAISHLLIGIGLFIICVSSLSFLAALGFGIDLKELTGGGGFIGFFKNSPEALKIFVFLSSSLPLILAGILIAILVKADVRGYLLLYSPKNLKWFGLSILFVFLCLPLMGPLLELNKLIDFSQFTDLYNSLMANEDANNKAYEAMMGNKSIFGLLTSLLFMALLPAIAEELFFRGFLMNVFNGIFKNMHVAIIVTAVIFSLIHMQFLKAIPIAFLGVVFGYAVYWTGSIWTAIAAHFLNNAVVVFQLFYMKDGGYEEVVNSSPSLPTLSLAIITIIVIGLFYYINKNSNTKTINFYE